MTQETKIDLVQALLNNDALATDSLVSNYLTIAQSRIMNRAYPLGTTETDVPTEYEVLQCELAVRLFLNRGAEGEKNRSENGTSISFSDNEDLLSQVKPFVGFGR